MQDQEDGIRRVTSGIQGFDGFFGGGIPFGRTLLVTGDTGTGKTVLLNEFIYRGVTEYDEPGIFITFEESAADVRSNVLALGWDYAGLEKAGRLRIVEVTPEVEAITLQIEEGHNLSRFLDPILKAIATTGATRVAIDGVSALFGMFQSEIAVRHLFHLLIARLKEAGVTTMLSAETEDGRSVISTHGIERFVVDGILHLTTELGEVRAARHMLIRKLRGASYQSGRVHFIIDEKGLRVFPQVPLVTASPARPEARRKDFGISGFDQILQGGLPESHLALISGNTGTGKTTFALHFLKAGCDAGEPGIFIAVEEPSAQVRQTAAGYGWNLDEHEAQGRLHFLDLPPIDLRTDEILGELAATVRRTGARRLVIDSLTGMESALLNPEAVRLFLEQLSNQCKAEHVTCILPYTAPAIFGARQGQLFGALSISEARLASVVDAIIVLRFVESEQEVMKLVNVIKMRGSQHAKEIFRYEIGAHGVEMGRKLPRGRNRRPVSH